MVAVDYEELPAVADRARRARRRRAAALCPRRPATSRSTGPARCRTTAAMRARSRRFSPAPRTWRASRWSTSASSSTPWSRAARPRATMRRPTATRCARARRAPARSAISSSPITGLPREKLRVITEDVGGAFGLKTPAYPEYPCLLVAAKLTGRPVAWMATRSESFLSDQHARDTVTRGRACDRREGKIPRVAREAPRRDGRLHRRARRAHPDQQFLALLSRHVRDPAHPGRTCNACSPTRCRPGPIAAPGGRRRTTRWSGWSTRPRASPASIRCGCAGAI